LTALGPGIDKFVGAESGHDVLAAGVGLNDGASSSAAVTNTPKASTSARNFDLSKPYVSKTSIPVPSAHAYFSGNTRSSLKCRQAVLAGNEVIGPFSSYFDGFSGGLATS
jgi:hypothetical protein